MLRYTGPFLVSALIALLMGIWMIALRRQARTAPVETA